jgi:phosphatidylserine/phosphatidylglycerophosphate/cardiolipin synthase-like enzyme
MFGIAGAHAFAAQAAPPGVPFAATGTIQYAFTPGDHVDSMIIAAIDDARQQVLVQAYSFTHRRIADALLRARRRGVEVAVIVDAEQAGSEPGVLRDLERGNVPVRHDPRHAAAHNKTIVIDAGLDNCAVMTGSFNFTYAAQQRNAENALILRGNAALCEAYYNNWRRHYTHASMRR